MLPLAVIELLGIAVTVKSAAFAPEMVTNPRTKAHDGKKIEKKFDKKNYTFEYFFFAK